MFEAVLEYISKTNLFNFIIFASIIVYLFFKLDVIGMLNAGKKTVAEKIENSENAKIDSESKLKSMEEKFENIGIEIDNIIKESECNAKTVGEKILTDAEKTVENIKQGAIKQVENTASVLKNDILRRTSIASIETAKSHIINELANNYDLHIKLIDDSVETVNGVDLQ